MSNNSELSIISEQDAITIFKKCKEGNEDAVFKNYSLHRASEKMLGFLSDYWKLEIQFTGNKQIQSISFFIKSISQSNASKAKMVKEMKLFDKELTFYVDIRNKINLADLAPWSANLVMTLNEAMVFENLNFLQYRIRNKHETFDHQHTLLALQALARFHAGSLIYEEKKRKQLKKHFIINDEHKEDLNRGGYIKSDPWFIQCMNGALEAIKSFSKYNNNLHILKEIENRWSEVWDLALDLSHFSFKYRNVICHRDLWNNNILFRYKEEIPDNCVLVDFQAVTCQPPAGDVMLLLHCNLDPVFREENMTTFLEYYYRELQDILGSNDVTIEDILSLQQFQNSCKKYKLWGLVATACLVPQFWVDDDLTLKYFSDTDSFREILTKDKGSFIRKMMGTNDDYKNKVMQKCKEVNEDAVFKNYTLHKASEKMLGFLSDYWKLEIQFTANKQIQSISFFIKSISQSNASKAKAVKELKLFDKELTFYVDIRDKINLTDLAPWSANFVMTLNEAMVFEDLNFLQYRIRNKHETFDHHHTLLALQALARFHAGSLIYEEKKRKQLKKHFIINDEHKDDLNRGAYIKSDLWFIQCMNGALEAIKSFSKYNNNLHILKEIENRWTEVWDSALDLSHFSFEYRNVICHRDLWNNNILFRYKEEIPDNCVLVDFQVVTCQPPAGDVMFLLHCNLDPVFREENMTTFLKYYYQELQDILGSNDVTIEDILSLEQFQNSCKKYKLWGLVAAACLVPMFWVDDDLTIKYFSDADSFGEILAKDKGSFIRKMMGTNDDYKNKVMQVFEEIVDIYCLDKKSL
ncbi:uncharacterized protein LOC123872495 isoform X1 [Maniola jurtina]|uniref:uncharacterized protein LOC123872495 isoform X1 n=1 Tax=Maniola jurtina TaxID=191418 RepID=UPI001E68FD30|nr:uncharacterized protein LOC123872495 isoform X1 [Maniola jurtina]